MYYSGDITRTICEITGSINNAAVKTINSEAVVPVGDIEHIYVWATGTTSTSPSGTIDLVIQGKTGDMPIFVNTSTITLVVLSTGTHVMAGTEITDFNFSTMKVVSAKNKVGQAIGDIKIEITGMN